MTEIILAIGIVFFFLSLLVLILTFTIKRVNVLMKKTFIDKLQEYDYLINIKEKKIDSLDKSIDKKTKSFVKLENEVVLLEKKLEDVEEIKRDHVILPTDADFEDGNILSGYKKIKEGFKFDIETIIKDFLSNKSSNDENYDIYCNVKNYFTHSSIYTIMTHQSEEQKLIINELLSEKEKEVLNGLISKKKFNIVKFIDDLESLILNSNPEIKIYIGNENKNFDYLDNNIITIYDENITEGFKIVYKGIIYDYSI